MRAKTLCLAGLLAVLAAVGNGCAVGMYGYTEDIAMDRYLLIDGEYVNFGYKRLTYIKAARKSVRSFMEATGNPDLIYEHREKTGRVALRLYYVEQDTVFVFLERSPAPDSMYIKEIRPITDAEWATYLELYRATGRIMPTASAKSSP